MMSFRVLAISLSWAALSPALLRAEDLSRYRQFQLEMKLTAVAEQAGMKPAEAKVLHLRPALIQELSWYPQRNPATALDTDPVKEVLFSFHNGDLFRMVITYDRYRTEGLTNEDMIEAVSKKYGEAGKPDGEILFPSIYNETVRVIARWEDSNYSFNLVRSSYSPGFGIVVISKHLDDLAQAAIVEAVKIEEREAPQREIARNKALEDESRVQMEKARLANRPNFRP